MQEQGNNTPETENHTDLTSPHHIHHTAYRCRDAEQTRWFYEDVLGMPLAAAMVFDEEPGTGKKTDYMHLFFQLPDSNFIAFFDVPETLDESQFAPKHGFDQHLALEVDTMDELKTWQEKINKAGRPCFGPIDHDFIHSIYMYDPNGIQLEITIKDANYEEILKNDSKIAHQVLETWTEKTREIKLARTSARKIDGRGLHASKTSPEQTNVTTPKHHHASLDNYIK